MGQLLLMTFPHRLIERFHQVQARFGDANLHDAAVAGNTLTSDQAALLQAVDQPGDVWGVRNQPAGQG